MALNPKREDKCSIVRGHSVANLRDNGRVSTLSHHLGLLCQWCTFNLGVSSTAHADSGAHVRVSCGSSYERSRWMAPTNVHGVRPVLNVPTLFSYFSSCGTSERHAKHTRLHVTIVSASKRANVPRPVRCIGHPTRNPTLWNDRRAFYIICSECCANHLSGPRRSNFRFVLA